MNLNYFFLILIFNFLISNVLLFTNHISKRKSIYLINHYQVICKFYHENNDNYGFIVNLFLVLIYSINDFFDSIYNAIKLFYKNSNSEKTTCFTIRYKTAIELLSLSYLVMTFSFWFWNGNNCSEIIASFFLYRIFYILFFKIAEIVRIGRTEKDIGNISNFIRTFLLSLFNFAEITIGFSFIYFYTEVLAENNIDSIFFTLNLFTSMGINNNIHICAEQKYIILFQIIVFFIFLTVFITNITNLKYMKNNEKKES